MAMGNEQWAMGSLIVGLGEKIMFCFIYLVSILSFLYLGDNDIKWSSLWIVISMVLLSMEPIKKILLVKVEPPLKDNINGGLDLSLAVNWAMIMTMDPVYVNNLGPKMTSVP
jgi:hypothetical protein